MKHLRIPLYRWTMSVALGLLVTSNQSAWAIVAPSTYTTAIQVQGEVEGTEFDDWASSGIPVAVTDAEDNGGDAGGFVDINEIQIANDSDFLYLRVSTYSNSSISLDGGFVLGFDMDQDGVTGYDMQAEVGLADPFGSEIGFSTDYPFKQEPELYWDGPQGFVDYGGDYIGIAPIFPFWDVGPPAGTQMEWAIPLTLAEGPSAPGTPVFDGDSFDLVVYTFSGSGDVAEVISYTLADAPSLAGDFDVDGDVDGTDFLEWQQDGSLGATDLSDWDTNYGSGVGAVLGTVAVPEPATCMLAAIGCLTLVVRRR